jgi:hypothetical protein
MIKNCIKRRDDGSYRKFGRICNRNGKKKFKIVSVDRRRPNSGFKNIKCPMHATLVEEGGKDSEYGGSPS